ncbi:MAG: aldehyde dehydrogenase family protein [Cyclobacteriaceae bacterium]|nr:aldehyde dehydrogenase family protein [Cyclobacteriaceae bacterium]
MQAATVGPSESQLKERFEKIRLRSLALRKEPLSDRKKRLRKLESWIHAQRDRIRQAVHQDYRKPLMEVDTTEIYPVLTEIRHTLKHLDRWASPRKIDATLSYVGTRSEIRYEPKGTCLIIAPWNFPFNLCVGPLVSCLAAGNNAIIKPSEMTPCTSSLIREMVAEVFEDDIAFVVEGGADVSQQLLKLPFDHIFFTGSTHVGKLVMEAAARNLSSVTLELGGKTPTVIDASANVNDAAIRIAFGKYMNNGQTCIAPDYLLIENKVKDKFIESFKKEVCRFFGDGKEITEKSSSYSRMATTRQYSRVAGLIDDAIGLGATAIRLGAFNAAENFLGPTILMNVPAHAKIWGEEIFGPVLLVGTFDHQDEVVQFINSRPKPLALYIFSNRSAFREHILQNTSSGSVCLNDCVLQFTHPNLPFGGVNQSGIGKSHGQFGFLAFSNEKSVLRQKRGWAAPYLLHPPYTNSMKKTVDLLLKWF